MAGAPSKLAIVTGGDSGLRKGTAATRGFDAGIGLMAARCYDSADPSWREA